MAQVKGSAILSRLQYVEAKHGAQGSERLISSLAAETQGVLRRGLLAHQWAPYDAFVDVNVVADRLFGKGDLALCFEMGRHSAETNLPTLYRIFYRLGSPMFIFRKAARVWEVHYDSGRLVPVQDDERVIRVKILDFERPHRAHCLSVLGWAARSVEMSGATLTRAEEEKCRTRGDHACEMVCAWESGK